MSAGITGPPVTRLQGQQLARRELARALYRPSLLSRLWHDVETWLSSLGSSGSAGSPSWWGLILLAVVVMAAVAAAMFWLGPTRVNKQARGQPVLDRRPRSADDYRRAAEQLAAGEDYHAAIIERIRAIAVDLEAREILLPSPARTALELAVAASTAFPAEARSLTSAARLFDDVRYGGRAGTQAGYLDVRGLDIRLKAATPSPAGPGPAESVAVGLPPAGAVLSRDDQSAGAVP